MTIDSFSGEYAFLSNFYPCSLDPVLGVYPQTVEHAFQAAKAGNQSQALSILRAPTPAKSKAYGRAVARPADWDARRLKVMFALVSQKFSQLNPSLVTLLLATGDRPLIEGNHWNDTFWGVCKGVGENHLGKLLCDRRQLLRATWVLS
jgi:ribA/ribD-fused uncharacterized protein